MLSVDETNWLDNFFLTNITPLFFAETLADLEKEVAKGKSPEEVVGHLALKTPDMHSSACTHHERLIGGSLYGQGIPMDGRIPINAGRVVELDGKRGVFYDKSPEEEALHRWQEGEFLDLERQIAKHWRQNLCNMNHEASFTFFQQWFHLGKPKDLAGIKTLADAYIDGSPPDGALRFGLSMMGVPQAKIDDILGRWQALGGPPLLQFAPYFRHTFGVDLFFNLAIAADLISRVRPKGKADNKVDIAYVYYLPFCHVFVSNDKLHRRVVPLFLRDDQSFIVGEELKADLQRLDTHFSRLTEAERNSGFYRIAPTPPEDASFLVTRLWDKHLPKWRQLKKHVKGQGDPEADKKVIAELKRIEEAAASSDPGERLTPEQTEFLQIKRNVLRRKGKWTRYPPDA